MRDDDLYFSSDYRKKLDENGEFTRDIPYLNLYDNHYVFVYGTLKRTCSRHNVLSSSRTNVFGGVAMTKDKNFDLVLHKESGIPVVLENTTKERLHAVKGELWLIDTETLIKLDHIESNGFVYERELRKVWVGKECITAWMYIGNNRFWLDKNVIDFPKFITPSDGASVPKDYFHQYSEIIGKRLAGKEEGVVHVG